MKRGAGVAVRFFSIFLVTIVLALTLTGITWANNGNAGHVADELLVKIKSGVSKGKIAGILERLGAGAVGEIPALQVIQIRVPAHALENVKTALANNPNISFVEYNFIAEISLTPDDERFPLQWHLLKISGPQGWNVSTGSTGVPIAVIDSGVDPSHPDLSSKILPGYNFLKENTDTHDVHGHGTMVAGSAAALSNNVIGVASVAWENPVMPLVVVNRSGWATYYNMSRAIIYAVDNGIRVMNLSLAGSSSSTTLQDAVDYAWNTGAVILAAAGNSSTDTPYYPAACDNVVAVSATNSGDFLAGFSNYGNWITVSAPGDDILTTTKGGGYAFKDGTSFASPLTAGLAALVMSVNPDLTNAKVIENIEQNADDLGVSDFDIYFGHGRINMYNSLVAASDSGPIPPDPDITEPTATITFPADGSTISGTVTVSVLAEDNIGVSYVELHINGTVFDTDIAEPYSFLWNTEDYTDGAHQLTAFSYDNSGNEGVSSPVTIYVSNPTQGDTIAPDVLISSPDEGSKVKRNTMIKAAASDNVGVIRVEFYIDNVLRAIQSATRDTYSWKWNTGNASNGNHTITVKAYDEAGNVGIDSVSVDK
jgi:subtilisin family serine protease